MNLDIRTMQVYDDFVQSTFANPQELRTFNLLDNRFQVALLTPSIILVSCGAKEVLELPDVERGDNISQCAIESKTFLALVLA